MPRQNVFSCITCYKKTGKYAALCKDCAFKCHEGHDVEDLYSKRLVRCDCGNGRFDAEICKIEPQKHFENVHNVYNHNFERKYCVCEGEYGDQGSESDQIMLQCISCEDWYHLDVIF